MTFCDSILAANDVDVVKQPNEPNCHMAPIWGCLAL